ncbi:MAG TPA: hypothetical protein VFY10_11825 [Dehalococcoidia bacterium]|nr:hypothetical protein [Dehalococcoidia bacterium]
MNSKMFGVASQDDELVRVLAAYFEQADRGDGEAVIEAHPELGSAIRELLGLESRMLVEMPGPTVEETAGAHLRMRIELNRLRGRGAKLRHARPRFLAFIGAIGLGLGMAGAFASGAVPSPPINLAIHSLQVAVSGDSSPQASGDVTTSGESPNDVDVTVSDTPVRKQVLDVAPNAAPSPPVTDASPIAPDIDGNVKTVTGATDPPSSHSSDAATGTLPLAATISTGLSGDHPGNAGNPPGLSGDHPGNGGNPPGLSGDNPGIGATPPGLSSDNPGSGGTPPGLSGDNPGNGGTPPGLSGDNPGNGGNPPGLGSDNPGNGGNPPGLTGDNPGNGGTPPGLSSDNLSSSDGVSGTPQPGANRGNGTNPHS